MRNKGCLEVTHWIVKERWMVVSRFPLSEEAFEQEGEEGPVLVAELPLGSAPDILNPRRLPKLANTVIVPLSGVASLL